MSQLFDRYYYLVIGTSLVAQTVKASAFNAGDLGLIPGLGRSPGEGNGSPLQYCCLENPIDKRSLAGCSPWGHKESDTTEWLHFHLVNLNSFHWKENSYKAHDLCIIFIKLMYMFLVHLSLPLVLVLSCPALCDLMDSSTRLLCPWEFSRQEYWSGLSFPSPRNFPNPGIELRSPVLQADSLPSEPFTFNGYH